MTALVDLYGATQHTDARRVDLQRVRHRHRLTVSMSRSRTFAEPHRMRREAIAVRLRLLPGRWRKTRRRDADPIRSTRPTSTRRTLQAATSGSPRAERDPKRINDEIASLYDKPALRRSSTRPRTRRSTPRSSASTCTRSCRRLQRITTLCNEILLWQYRASTGRTSCGSSRPTSSTRSRTRKDVFVKAGFVIDIAPVTIDDRRTAKRLPHYEVWDDTFRYLINANGQLVERHAASCQHTDRPDEHGLGRIPGVLFHRASRRPRLDARHGSDIESAHFGVRRCST
jgi:hypothetical protein